jgi:hypothetical protein
MPLFGKKDPEARTGFSKTKLLLGAGGLLLFIIGLKRSHTLDEPGGSELHDGGGPDDDEPGPFSPEAIEARSRRR